MVFCGFFPKLRRGSSSSNRTGTNDASPVKTVRTNMGAVYAADLSSYTSACKKDSSLKSFDAWLHQRTNRVISSLAAQAKTQQFLNQDSLLEVYEFLFELNQDAVKVIIESREDVFKNKDLEPLVDAYFESTAKTLDFCNTVDKCVRKAEISQLIIRLAVKQFEKETVETDVGGSEKKKKYAKTLEELNKFKATGNPFDGEFLTQHESVWKEQVLLLDELRELRKRLDKKKSNVKTWRRVLNVVFATAFVSVLVLSVVTAAMSGAPQVVAAVASGLTAPIEVVGMWCNKMLKKYEKAVKRQRDFVDSLKLGAQANKEATVNIYYEADNLRERIKSIMENVEFAMEREEEEIATRAAMQKIKKEVEGLTEKIKEVGDRAAKCSQEIALGRLIVLDHILKSRIVQSML